MPDADRSLAEERRRAALRRAIKTFDITPAELARRAGLKSANLLYSYLTGRSKSLSVESIEALAKALPGDNVAALLGASKYVDDRATKPVTVAYRSSLDAFKESAFLPPDRQYQIGIRRTNLTELFGVEVGDNSSEGLLPGSVAICQHMKAFKGELEPGMRVCVRRVDEVFGREEVSLWRIDRGQLINAVDAAIPMKQYRGPFKHGALTVEILGVVIGVVAMEAWLKA